MSDDNTFGTRTAVEGMDDAVIKRDEAAAPPKSSETAVEQQPPKKKKHKTGEGHTRVRRVGRVPTKSSEEILSAMNQGGQQQQQQQLPQLAQSPESVTLGEAAAVAAAACVMETPPPPAPLFKVQSKHDEKWNKMFNELVEYKKHFNTTNVPQCYDKNVRLGRWTHYQRVEYWLYQSKGKAKINAHRIARLESIGFEWDPQRAQWEKMYQLLCDFKKQHGHVRVPKGFTQDPELANWVRNQRLEHSNMQRGKKTRMTKERLERLEALGFKWSTSKVSSKKPSELNTTSATTNNANNNNGETPNAMTQTTNDGTMMV